MKMRSFVSFTNSNITTCDPYSVPALHHLDAVLLVSNNAQLGQRFKQVVTLQNQIPLKGQVRALLGVMISMVEHLLQV